MNKASFFFKDSKSYSEGSNLQSIVIGQTLSPFYVIASSFSIICIATTYYIQKGMLKVYPHLAKASFFVFLSHIFVLDYMSNIINKCIPIENGVLQIIIYLITPFATVTVCLIIYKLLDNFFPKLLAFITGNRK